MDTAGPIARYPSCIHLASADAGPSIQRLGCSAPALSSTPEKFRRLSSYDWALNCARVRSALRARRDDDVADVLVALQKGSTT